MEFGEDEYLQLSGIQHYAFCPRQWALIHVENLWRENGLTSEGEWLHKVAHDDTKIEKRRDLIIVRGMRIFSQRLGLSGQCDIVEFHKSNDGIKINGWPDCWIPYPIEYKHGVSKINDCDRLQVCAQVICIEEMMCCEINEAALFYGEPQKREQVEMDCELRSKVEDVAMQMHELIKRNYTPRVKRHKGCISCSIKDFCLPELGKTKKVEDYLNENL